MASRMEGFTAHTPSSSDHIAMTSLEPARLGSLETNRAPLPHAAAGRARIAHTPGPPCLYQRPQTLFKYALQALRARHFPCKARPSAALIALPRCKISFALSSCHTAAPFVSPSPVLLRYIRIIVAAVSLQDPEHRLMHACARPD
jgi:hypothetical protein